MDAFKNVVEWSSWEIISHLFLILLNVYILYMFVLVPETRTMTNVLLYTIVVAISVIIHQRINDREK